MISDKEIANRLRGHAMTAIRDGAAALAEDAHAAANAIDRLLGDVRRLEERLDELEDKAEE